MNNKAFIKLSPLFCISLAIMLLTLPLRWLFAAVIAAVYHELCHIAAIRLCHGDIKLQQAIRKIKVKAVYANIPEKLTVDVTELALGKSIKVGDLSFEGLELVTPAQTVVCSVAATRASREAANGKK